MENEHKLEPHAAYIQARAEAIRAESKANQLWAQFVKKREDPVTRACDQFMESIPLPIRLTISFGIIVFLLYLLWSLLFDPTAHLRHRGGGETLFAAACGVISIWFLSSWVIGAIRRLCGAAQENK